MMRITTREQASEYASEWIRIWNSSDLEALLAHYDDGVVFTSPRAKTITGTATIHGKKALREYWAAAVQRNPSRRFTLEHVIWDGERSELVIVYLNESSTARVRACEFFRFGSGGMVVEGEAMYGADL